MKEDLTIRRYKPSDSDRVWTIHERALRTSPLEFIEDAPADRDITEISEQYIDANGEFIVGLVNDEIVAIGGFQPKGDEVLKSGGCGSIRIINDEATVNES